MTLNLDRLMKNPKYMVPLLRKRVQVTIGNDGVASANVVETNFLGSVMPEGRGADFTGQGQRVSGSVSVITSTELYSGDNQNNGADMIVYKGKDYLVKNAKDYSAWGNGFYQASCEVVL